MRDVGLQIIELLKKELSLNLIHKVDEIEMLIRKEKYREAYLNMYELKSSKEWSQTSEYLQLIERFWWDYAN